MKERVKHLEDVERFIIDGLEMATSLGDFQNSISKLSDVSTLLEETKKKGSESYSLCIHRFFPGGRRKQRIYYKVY